MQGAAALRCRLKRWLRCWVCQSLIVTDLTGTGRKTLNHYACDIMQWLHAPTNHCPCCTLLLAVKLKANSFSWFVVTPLLSALHFSAVSKGLLLLNSAKPQKLCGSTVLRHLLMWPFHRGQHGAGMQPLVHSTSMAEADQPTHRLIF